MPLHPAKTGPPRSRFQLPRHSRGSGNPGLLPGLFLSLFFLHFLLSTGEIPRGDAFSPFTGAISIVQGKGIPASKVMPGQTMLLVPIAWVTQTVVRAIDRDDPRWVAMILIADVFPALVTSGSALLLFRIARQIGHSPALSLFASLLFALASPAAVYAKSFFPQPTETFFLLGTLSGLLAARRAAGSDEALSRERTGLILSGASYGALLLVKLVAIAYLPVFLLFLLLAFPASGRTRRVLSWVTPALLLALLYFPYNQASRGNPLAFGYGQGRDAFWGFATPLLAGLRWPVVRVERGDAVTLPGLGQPAFDLAPELSRPVPAGGVPRLEPAELDETRRLAGALRSTPRRARGTARPRRSPRAAPGAASAAAANCGSTPTV